MTEKDDNHADVQTDADAGESTDGDGAAVLEGSGSATAPDDNHAGVHTDSGWDQPMPMRYLVGAVVVLSVLAAAAITPEVLPYLWAPKQAPTRTAASHAQPKGVATGQSHSGGSVAVLKASTGNPFETYARLVTLLMALLSVLGVFFGYFVRKSIRETEEDVERRIDRHLDGWKRERELLLEEYREKGKSVEGLEVRLRDIKTDLDAKLEEVSRLEGRQKELLDLLDSHYSQVQPDTDSAEQVQDAAAQVDEQLGMEQ